LWHSPGQLKTRAKKLVDTPGLKTNLIIEGGSLMSFTNEGRKGKVFRGITVTTTFAISHSRFLTDAENRGRKFI